jgi:hypothetical protein
VHILFRTTANYEMGPVFSTGHLKTQADGSCVFLKENRCSIWPHRPTQCATYPFWHGPLSSAVDWRAEATICEGITPISLPVVPLPAATVPISESSLSTGVNSCDNKKHHSLPSALRIGVPCGVAPSQQRMTSTANDITNFTNQGITSARSQSLSHELFSCDEFG